MKRVVIIGGGAAGFFAAVNLNAPVNTQVVILEKSNKVLAKVKISGGGRCNVTHACFDPKELVEFYPRGKKELLGPFHVFQCGDTFDWFAKRNVNLKIEDDGRVFPDTDSSQTIINCFLNEAEKKNIQIELSQGVESISKMGEKWLVETNTKNSFLADSVIFTAGSSPQMHSMLESIGFEMVNQVPSLFTFNIHDKRLHELAGISVPYAVVRIPSMKLISEGPLLVTHWGVSGPAILRLSAYAARQLNAVDYKFQCLIDWTGGLSKQDVLEKLKWWKETNNRRTVHLSQPFQFAQRLWTYIVGNTIPESMNWADISNKSMEVLAENICAMPFQVDGKSTFKDEFVTAGGVKLSEIDFKTMESKRFPGIYFAGEVLDIDAITGGFNFQAAWTTAYISAMSVSKTLQDEKSY